MRKPKLTKLEYFKNYKWCAETLTFVKFDGNYAVFKNKERGSLQILPMSVATTLKEVEEWKQSRR